MEHNDLSYYGANSRPEVANIIPALPPGARYLEIGCGVGKFRSNFGVECEYWGVEPFAPAADVARQSLDFVINAVFSEAVDLLPDRYFDCVICNDVIEHIADTQEFIHKIKLKMAKGAILVGSIPNVRHYSNLAHLIFKRDWNYTDSGIRDKTHLRFFTLKSIKRMLHVGGLHCKIISGANSTFGVRSGYSDVFSIPLIFLFGLDSRFLHFVFVAKSSRD